jgi:TPR repeat protein
LKLEPDNLQAMINSAGAYGMKEDWKTARYWLNRAAEQDPDHPDVIRGLEYLKRLSL